MSAELTFPQGFLWGSATAAHQVEGGNYLNDVSALEAARPSIFNEPAGDAVDQWNRFADDMAVLSSLGVNSYRFSIEWARVEPEDGFFSQAAVHHYQGFLDACRKHGITPVVTLHHFTQPRWLAKQGGMTGTTFVEKFSRYAQFLARSLSGLEVVCTINELNVPILVEHILKAALASGEGQAKLSAAERALDAPLESSFLFSTRETLLTNGIAAHRCAYEALKSIHPDLIVGATLSIQDEHALPGAERAREERLKNYVDPFLDALKGDDFIGVQNYTRTFSRPDGTAGPADDAKLTVMGYADCPEALAGACRYAWERTATPILVTENGWAGSNDARRSEFIKAALSELHIAIREGVDVRGYFYWSMLDNFEWVSGYGPKFGLIAVDRDTQRRHVKPSALTLAAIASANGIPSENTLEAESEVIAHSGVPLGID